MLTTLPLIVHINMSQKYVCYREKSLLGCDGRHFLLLNNTKRPPEVLYYTLQGTNCKYSGYDNITLEYNVTNLYTPKCTMSCFFVSVFFQLIKSTNYVENVDALSDASNCKYRSIMLDVVSKLISTRH